jgi:hypothetical protein
LRAETTGCPDHVAPVVAVTPDRFNARPDCSLPLRPVSDSVESPGSWNDNDSEGWFSGTDTGGFGSSRLWMDSGVADTKGDREGRWVRLPSDGTPRRFRAFVRLKSDRPARIGPDSLHHPEIPQELSRVSLHHMNATFEVTRTASSEILFDRADRTHFPRRRANPFPAAPTGPISEDTDRTDFTRRRPNPFPAGRPNPFPIALSRPILRARRTKPTRRRRPNPIPLRRTEPTGRRRTKPICQSARRRHESSIRNRHGFPGDRRCTGLVRKGRAR